MKRIQIILSVAVLIITLSGCGTAKIQNNNTNKNETTIDNKENITNNTKDNDAVTQKDSNDTKNNKTDQSTNSNTSSQNTDNKSNKDQKSFYGNWELKKVAGYAKVSTGEDESLIGFEFF